MRTSSETNVRATVGGVSSHCSTWSSVEAVTIQNSYPTAFDLLLPADGDTAGLRPTFVWNASTDPDSGDTVYYRLMVTGLSRGAIVLAEDITDTTFRPDTTVADSGTVTWIVQAYDPIDATTGSSSDFQYVVMPMRR